MKSDGGSAGANADARGESEALLDPLAPDASVFAPKRSTCDLIEERRIHTRRTMIPILLTCGVLMPAVGSLKWLMDDGSPFAAWPAWPPVVLAACGLVLLALAVANMVQVRHTIGRTSSTLRREPLRHAV